MRVFLLTTGGTEVGWSRHNEEGVFRDYEAEADRLIESAKPFGFECIKFNNEYFYNRPYYESHKDVMDKVSFGFTMKAIELYETIRNPYVDMGDIIILTDSNHIVVEPAPLLAIADEYGHFIYDHIWARYLNKNFTRRDTFVNMGCDEEQYWNSIHVQCNLFAFKKTPLNIEFAEEYFNDCLTYNIMFGENKYPNFEGFVVHRHDQSIFSILRQKYRLLYLNRTNTVWTENIIPERNPIISAHPVDNRWRRDEDNKENA